MPRTRTLVASLALLTLIFTAPALAQTTQDAKIKQLEAKITALEKKVAALEAKSGRGGATGAAEQEAEKALNEVNKLVAEGDMAKAKTQMTEFMKSYGSTNVARRAGRMSQELSVIGKNAPAKWGIDRWFQGQSDIDLSNGKTTLLVFWELWCPHCKREVPKLQQLYTSLKGDGLQLVGLTRITKSATEDAVASFIKDQNVSYPMAKENGEVASYFNVSGIPAAAVIKDNKVIWRGHPARISKEMLEKWL